MDIFLNTEISAQIIRDLPNYVFCKDRHLVYRACNINFAKFAGFLDASDIIGKTDTELPWAATAHIYQEEDREILRTGLSIISKEVPMVGIGEDRVLLISKTPLFSNKNHVIGILGIYIDITDQKKLEESLRKEAQLKLENEMQQKSLEEQKEFTKVANQVAHDIRSPLASLLMIIKSCTEIPEAERVALREAAISIGDIASNLLSRYVSKNAEAVSELEISQPILVFSHTLAIIS